MNLFERISELNETNEKEAIDLAEKATLSWRRIRS
jgi:hypothetical protein